MIVDTFDFVIHKDELFDYIINNFDIEWGTARMLVFNILTYVVESSLSSEDTITSLLCLLDNTGITREEIEKFIEEE